MSIEVATLNVYGSNCLDTVKGFLRSQPLDVICLQEVMEHDFSDLQNTAGMQGKFFPMAKLENDPVHKPGTIGVALLSKLPYEFIQGVEYYGDCSCEEKDQKNWGRVLAIAKLIQNGTTYYVATTHFEHTWNGEISERQEESFDAMMEKLSPYENLILPLDTNSPRGGKMFSRFEGQFKDNLPYPIISTIDTQFHRKKDLCAAVDNIFTRGKYSVRYVRMINGISDHAAIVGTVVPE